MVILHNFFNPSHFEYFLDKYKELPITLFMDYKPNLKELSLNPIKIYLIHEPNELFGVHDFVAYNHHAFNLILTYNKLLLNKLPNTIEFSFGLPNTEDKEYYDKFLNPQKEFKVSFLCGIKTESEGHQMRQNVYKLKDLIKTPNNWEYTLDDFDQENQVRPGYSNYSKSQYKLPKTESPEIFGKRILFDDYMFHVAIENVKVDNWYTEKISQAFATKTIPLYWGCSNIGELGYDERGIIRFNDEEELINIINNLTPEDYYSRLPYIEHNYQLAMEDTFKNKLSLFLDQIKSSNNL